MASGTIASATVRPLRILVFISWVLDTITVGAPITYATQCASSYRLGATVRSRLEIEGYRKGVEAK